MIVTNKIIVKKLETFPTPKIFKNTIQTRKVIIVGIRGKLENTEK